MTKLRVALVIACLVGLPRGAFAEASWWDTLEQFSGPGPFKRGITFEQTLFCVQGGSDSHTAPASNRRDEKPYDWFCFNNDRDGRVRSGLNLNVSFFSSGDRPLFGNPDDIRTVHAFRLTLDYQFRVAPMIDIGPGVGFIRLSGDGLTPLYRPTFTAMHITFYPLWSLRSSAKYKNLARLIRVDHSELYVPGFSAADLGVPTSSYSNNGEFVRTLGVGVNFGVLFSR